MKALTIKQPWASLIAHGIKDIENRTWRTHFRGRIYIHASAKVVKETHYTDAQMIAALPIMTKDFNLTKAPVVPSFFQTSVIIGEVDIVDCVINHPSIWAEQMAYDVCPNTGLHILRKGQPYIWNWVLANPVLYDKPIENVKGALSFWEYCKP